MALDNGTLPCHLCGRWEDARSMGEQLGVNLCRSCDGQYDDDELRMELSTMSTTVEEVITKALAPMLNKQQAILEKFMLAVSRCQETEELELRLRAVQSEIYNAVVEAPDAVSHLTQEEEQ